MAYFMGIDVGTSSTKTILVDEKGRIVLEANREYDIEKPNASFAEQDMENLWNAVKETIAEITGKLGDQKSLIKGIGYSGQMHGLVMLDKDRRLLGKSIIWADQRSGQQKQEIYQAYGEMKYKNLTLNDLSSGFLLTSLLWIKENDPNLYEKIDKVLLPKDYIRYRMCGEIGTDYSDASATLMFDTKKAIWSWELADQFGFDHEMFPDCYESHEVAGYVTAECAKETGLCEETVIVFGGGDSIMQQIGNGVISECDPWILNIGTSCSVNCASERPIYDKEFRVNTFCHARKNRWFWMGANLCGGMALKWAKNNVFHMNSYDEMSALADTVEPGSNGVLFLPYLTGSRSPVNDTKAQGIYFGLTTAHNRAHMVRSVMEGIVLGMKTTGMIFEEGGLKTEELISSGGGARSKVFMQMQADIFKKPVKVAENKEQSCLGAAIVAAVGCGVYKNYREACAAMVRYKDQIICPKTENFERYDEAYAVYKEIYKINAGLMHKNIFRIH